MSIDALRGIAVLGVIAAHLPFSWRSFDSAKAAPVFSKEVCDWLGFGGFGVHLFLVISGFCIHLAVAGKGAEMVSFLVFWRRRLHRLYAPYLTAVALSIFGLFCLFGLMGSAGPRAGASSFGYESPRTFWMDVASLITLTQNITGAGERVGNGPFWTLALEEQLYFLYFPLLWLRAQLGWRRALMAIFACTMAWRLVGMIGVPHWWWYRVGPARWIEWACGAYCAELYTQSAPMPRIFQFRWVVAATFAFISLWHLGYFDSTSLGGALVDPAASVMCVGLLGTLVTRERNGWIAGRLVGVFAAVGIFSYSLYLTHEPIMVASKRIAMAVGLGIMPVAVVRVGAAIAGGWVFFLFVERHFINRSMPSNITADSTLTVKQSVAVSER